MSCCVGIRCWLGVHRMRSQLHSQQRIPTQHDMLRQHHVYRIELNCEFISLFNQLDAQDLFHSKGHVWGLFGTAACRPIVPLPHAPHRHEGPLPAKEGNIQGILLAHRNSRRY